MKKSIKLICLTGCMIFALALLSGCSLFGPKSAEDVIEKYSKVQEKIENFNMKGTIDMTETLTTDNAEVQAALGTTRSRSRSKWTLIWMPAKKLLTET